MYNFAQYFLSMTMDNYVDLTSRLLKSRTLSTAEKEDVNTYIRIVQALQAIPSRSRLQTEFPKIDFNNVKPLSPDDISEQIRLDIQKRKETIRAQKLMQASGEMSKKGATDKVKQVLQEVLQESESNDNKYVDITPELKGIYQNASKTKGISTGIPTIDELTGGLQLGTFNCLAGFAGAGKTTLAVNIAYNALKDSKNVCYITLEVPKVDMYYNFGSRHSFDAKFKKPISHSDLKKRAVQEDDANYFFDEVITDFNNLPGKLYILDETDFSNYDTLTFEAKMKDIDKLAQEQTGKGIDLVIVDQAQLLKFSKGLQEDQIQVINTYVSFFRKQAISFLSSDRKTTVLMLSQINRDGYKHALKNGGRYNLTSLAESNELERASAMAMSVFTDESLKASKQAQVQLLKSRNGQTMLEPAIVFFDPVYYAFGDGADAGASGQMFMGGGLTDLIGAGIQTINLDEASNDTASSNVVNESNDYLSELLQF